MSWNLGASTSWNPQGLSRPVQGLLYLFMTTAQLLKLPSYGIWRFSAMFTSICHVNTVHIHTFYFRPSLVLSLINAWISEVFFLSFQIFWLECLCMLDVLSNFVFTDLNILIIFGDVHKSWYPSKHSSSYLPLSLSMVGPNILLSIFFSNTHNTCYMQIHDIKKGKTVIILD
jgi:hypothetical protein